MTAGHAPVTGSSRISAHLLGADANAAWTPRSLGRGSEGFRRDPASEAHRSRLPRLTGREQLSTRSRTATPRAGRLLLTFTPAL